MKRHLLIAIAVIAGLTGTLAAKTPIQEARQHLERAHTLITKKEEGGAGAKRKRGRASIPNIVAALSAAEVSLNEAKNNKGSNLNVALNYFAEAKSEIEAAKSGEGDHLEKADKAIEEALKRVMQAIQH